MTVVSAASGIGAESVHFPTADFLMQRLTEVAICAREGGFLAMPALLACVKSQQSKEALYSSMTVTSAPSIGCSQCC